MCSSQYGGCKSKYCDDIFKKENEIMNNTQRIEESDINSYSGLIDSYKKEFNEIIETKNQIDLKEDEMKQMSHFIQMLNLNQKTTFKSLEEMKDYVVELEKLKKVNIVYENISKRMNSIYNRYGDALLNSIKGKNYCSILNDLDVYIYIYIIQ